ncbi:hypothetical protein PMAYCL1PPCAC_23968 [Pristionchus mayeri]|uniref:TAFH domain-containing protein n=1 Tax=Pristionchus mayeri TaxID=1317129 RepID=A0AAN5I671_9BILA|nr:hypothetical protein PMAYCL1PPCAC_23968 [Pristionchus mayeri]
MDQSAHVAALKLSSPQLAPDLHISSVQMLNISGTPSRSGLNPPQIGGCTQLSHTPHQAASIPPTLSISTSLSSGVSPLAAEEEKGLVQKCARFFRTLIQLSQNETDPNRLETHARVTQLVSNVIFGDMEAEEFTARLQDALKSQAQPHLLPFLQRTLPYLRNALQSGEVLIEGIRPPSLFQTPPPADGCSRGSCVPPSSIQTPPLLIPAAVRGPASTLTPWNSDEGMGGRLLMETPIKWAMIKPVEIMRKITRRITNVCYVDEDVLCLISDAAEYRLRKVMSELTCLTEHRLYLLKSQPHYDTVDDAKKQIRFIEEVDREYEEKREVREKELIIRMSKNKKTGKETMERAKEVQKADAEVARNRDANAAAIAALSGGRRLKKWENMATHSSARPKTLRVNMRDVQSVLSRDARSKVAIRFSYALSLADAHT